jgi:predicted AlkP superfamily phosphohydrolase/phosphomutase
MASRRIVMLGIDAANPALLHEWVRDGTLPNLASLLARGLSAPTQSLAGFFVGSTWPSLYTGTTPARHGFHYQAQLRPGTYDLHLPQEDRLVKSPAFWHFLSEAGKRVAILDVPLTQLEPHINGIQMVEWGGHDAVYGFRTNPPELAQVIDRRFGRHPAGPTCDGVRRSSADYRQFADRLVSGVQLKTRITRELLGQEQWDFFAQVFTETHCAGHQCWHLHDERHPAFDAGVAAAAGDPIRSVYVAVDRAIGEIVRDAGDALVLVVSAHGMSSSFGAQFLLRDILSRLEVTRLPAASVARSKPESAIHARARIVWHTLPARLRATLEPVRDLLTHNDRALPAAISLGVDAQNSRCFPVGNGLAVGGIRLNIAGREPFGMLQPGAATDSFVAELCESLAEIVDQRTGKPLIRRVSRTCDLYEGPFLDALPDLLVEWSDDIATGSSRVGTGRGARVSAWSARIGHIEGENSYCRTGEHRPGGMFVAAGPGVAAGRIARTISILDFAPTICGILGVPLAVSDGSPITELIQ